MGRKNEAGLSYTISGLPVTIMALSVSVMACRDVFPACTAEMLLAVGYWETSNLDRKCPSQVIGYVYDMPFPFKYGQLVQRAC